MRARWRPSAHKNKAKLPGQGGFTIVEILISMLLLAIALVGLAALQIGTIRNVTDSKRHAEATRLAESVLEGYQVNSFSSLPPASIPPVWEIVPKPDSTPMQSVAGNGSDPGPFTAHRLVEDLPGNRRLITVRVSWVQTAASGGSAGTNYKTSSVLMSIQRSQ